MFENFFNFIDLSPDKEITTVDMFIGTVAGKTFFNGMFRFFDPNEKNKWNEIVTEYFSDYKNNIDVICYDWLGRVFALSKFTNTIIFFEPATGNVYNTDESIEKFFDSTVIEYTNDCFASDFFREWYEFAKEYQLSSNECVSYIIPPFLNGTDSVQNLEVCDMEVHWEIMRLAHDLSN